MIIANIAFDLFSPLAEAITDRKIRHMAICDRAMAQLTAYAAEYV